MHRDWDRGWRCPCLSRRASRAKAPERTRPTHRVSPSDVHSRGVKPESKTPRLCTSGTRGGLYVVTALRIPSAKTELRGIGWKIRRRDVRSHAFRRNAARRRHSWNVSSTLTKTLENQLPRTRRFLPPSRLFPYCVNSSEIAYFRSWQRVNAIWPRARAVLAHWRCTNSDPTPPPSPLHHHQGWRNASTRPGEQIKRNPLKRIRL